MKLYLYQHAYQICVSYVFFGIDLLSAYCVCVGIAVSVHHMLVQIMGAWYVFLYHIS